MSTPDFRLMMCKYRKVDRAFRLDFPRLRFRYKIGKKSKFPQKFDKKLKNRQRQRIGRRFPTLVVCDDSHSRLYAHTSVLPLGSRLFSFVCVFSVSSACCRAGVVTSLITPVEGLPRRGLAYVRTQAGGFGLKVHPSLKVPPSLAVFFGLIFFRQ